MSEFQDWNTIVFRKKPVKKVVTKTAAAGTRTGGDGYVTIKKTTGGTNTASSKPKIAASHLHKIENAEIPVLNKVSMSTRQAIAQGRQAKNLTQKELAHSLNVKPSIIQDYENGKAIPNSQFLSRMEKILDTKINGL
jgi:putative transcription factor